MPPWCSSSLVLARDLAPGLDLGAGYIDKIEEEPSRGCWGSARRSPGCILEPMAYGMKGLVRGAWRGGLLCSFKIHLAHAQHTHIQTHARTHTHTHRGARAHTLRAGHTRSHTCGIPCVFVQFLWKINAGHGSEREAGFVNGLYARKQS